MAAAASISDLSGDIAPGKFPVHCFIRDLLFNLCVVHLSSGSALQRASPVYGEEDVMKCPMCGGTGAARENVPPYPYGEIERKAVALITLALDHAIRDDDKAFTDEEFWAVMGDPPLPEVVPQLAMVTSMTAYILRNTAEDDDAARDWWSRIARHVLSGDEEE